MGIQILNSVVNMWASLTSSQKVILVSNLMGLYYAVMLLGDKIGLPIESFGAKFYGLKKASVVQASGASWTGVFLCTILADAFYVCFKCSEGARLRYCNTALIMACQRLTLQIAHSTQSIRTVAIPVVAKEYTAGLISSFVFIGLVQTGDEHGEVSLRHDSRMPRVFPSNDHD